eukprot:g3712.t1
MLAPRHHVHFTPTFMLDSIVSLLQVRKTDTVLEIGSGDARFLCLAAKTCGCICEGYEINKELVKTARARIEEENLQGLVSIHEGNALLKIEEMTNPESPFTCAFLYLNRHGLKRVLPYLLLKKLRIVTFLYAFDSSKVKPLKKVSVTDPENPNRVFLLFYYEFSGQDKCKKKKIK